MAMWEPSQMLSAIQLSKNACGCFLKILPIYEGYIFVLKILPITHFLFSLTNELFFFHNFAVMLWYIAGSEVFSNHNWPGIFRCLSVCTTTNLWSPWIKELCIFFFVSLNPWFVFFSFLPLTSIFNSLNISLFLINYSLLVFKLNSLKFTDTSGSYSFWMFSVM